MYASAALALILVLASASPLAPRDGCPEMHVMIARGSTEKTAFGKIGSLNSKLRATFGFHRSDNTSFAYPATDPKLGPTLYNESVEAGIQAVRDNVTSYVSQCGAAANIVLLGYSQGAQIISTALSRDGGLPASVTQHIKAIVTYGDPTHHPTTPREPFDYGNATHSGKWPRTDAQNALLSATFAGRLQAYCDDGDVYCDSGKNPHVHGEYFHAYNANATDFIISKFP